MKKNYFGRLPILNILLSNLLQAVIHWRIFALRCINSVKAKTKPKHYILANDISTANALAECRRSGYDKINIGGGNKNLKGFINIDFIRHPDVEREIVANILDLSFIPSASISQVHSNHVVEHLSQDMLQAQLSEWHRILRDDGLVSIRCPNALGVCFGFWFEPVLEQGRDEFIELGFPDDEEFMNPLDRWYHKDFYAFLHWIYGDVGNPANQHLNIITPTQLQKTITQKGFQILKMSAPEATNIVLVAKKIDFNSFNQH